MDFYAPLMIAGMNEPNSKTTRAIHIILGAYGYIMTKHPIELNYVKYY